MKRRKLIITLWSSVIFMSLVSGILASVAWFDNSLKRVDLDVNGSVVVDYFHCGNGTEQDPFVITRPIHFYHLVEFFQRETNLTAYNANFGTDYLYFQVGFDLDGDGDLEVYSYDDQGIYQGASSAPSYSNTLNMAYYSGTNSLMPIGTNEVPFIGSFDGGATETGGIVISNLNICCSETVVVGNTSTTRTASDIGIFGYVADADSDSNATVIKNARFDGVTIDLTDVASTVASSATNVAHLDAHDDNKAYVGYIAGHIHTYTNYDGSTNPVTNASPLYNVYVDRATVQGGPAAQNHSGTYCNYGYIGLVDSITDQAEVPSVSGEIGEINTGSGGGQGHEWGGSMNFKDFNARIKTQLSDAAAITYQQNPSNSPNSTSTTYQRFRSYENNYLSASIYFGSNIMSNVVNKNPNTTRVIYNYLDEGDYTRSNTTAVNGIPGTVQPLITASNDYYTPHEQNTGYIVSGVANKNYSNSNYGMTVRTASYEMRFVANSLGDTTFETYQINSGTNNGYTTGSAMTFPSYDKTKTEILTNSSATYSSNNYCFIKDEMEGYNQNHTKNYNYTKDNTTTPTALKLTKYNESRAALDEILNGQSYIHGLHFLGSSITYNNYVTRSNLKILGSTKNNYKLPKNAIDFNLLEDGKINFFAGSYYSKGTPTEGKTGQTRYDADSDNFFSLYHIVRSGDDLVSTSVKKISVVYENTNTNVDSKYVYQYSDNSYSSGTAGTRLFDMAYLDNCPVKNALYYFEIPVNSGEYAMGAANSNTSSYGGYLMYLDIGTSGDAAEPTVNDTTHVGDASLFTQIGFLNPQEEFLPNSCFNVAYIIPTGATKEKFSITISCGTDEDYPGYTCYEIVIINTTGTNFVLNALLMDDDSDPDSAYTYMYAITYNGGNRTAYTGSNTYTAAGTSQTTSMMPTYNSGS